MIPLEGSAEALPVTLSPAINSKGWGWVGRQAFIRQEAQVVSEHVSCSCVM